VGRALPGVGRALPGVVLISEVTSSSESNLKTGE
jgi:hypothetical protein